MNHKVLISEMNPISAQVFLINKGPDKFEAMRNPVSLEMYVLWGH